MIIISKFHDYYDGVSKSLGHDTTMRYIRVPKIISENSYYSGYYDEEISIGFCGKIYLCIKVNIAGQYEPAKYKFIYNQKEYDELFPRKLYKSKWKCTYPKRYKKQNIEWVKEDRSLFEEHCVPIWTNYGRAKKDTDEKWRKYDILEINSQLGQYEFFKIFPPWQAYQEITMFLGNLAWPEKPIPQISDEIMRDIKGFDKYSFRKDKQK